MKLSIVIPSCNEPKAIRTIMEAVRAASIANKGIIIVDIFPELDAYASSHDLIVADTNGSRIFSAIICWNGPGSHYLPSILDAWICAA